jgi:hypothetical protein
MKPRPFPCLPVHPAQLAGAAAALADAAKSAGKDSLELLQGIVSSLLSGNLAPDELRLPTMDLKVNM